MQDSNLRLPGVSTNEGDLPSDADPCHEGPEGVSRPIEPAPNDTDDVAPCRREGEQALPYAVIGDGPPTDTAERRRQIVGAGILAADFGLRLRSSFGREGTDSRGARRRPLRGLHSPATLAYHAHNGAIHLGGSTMLNADVGHVFVAYDHDDTERVVRLRDALVAAGLPIWWDQSIGHGDVIDAIEAAIRQSACVMPVWTAKSVKSRWVRDELRVAEEAGRSVCAVRLEAVSPPVGLGQSRAYDLFPLRGQKTPHFRDLVRTLSATIRAFASEAEPAIHLKSRKILQLPCFVRSVSSHETFLRPDVALRALQVMKTDAALVSAYDIAADSSDRVLRESNRLTRTGTILFLDSGNYEASRKSDSAWSARRFEKTIRHSRADLIFCFDNVHADSDQRILLRDTVTAYRRLTDLTDTTAIPVLHLPRSRAGRIKVESAPILAQEIMAETGARILAIPERELGDGLFARARVIGYRG